MKKALIAILLLFALSFSFFLGKRTGGRIQSLPFGEKREFTPPLPRSKALAPEKEITKKTEGESISQRLVIKRGHLSLLVTDVRKAVEKITKFAEEEGGFVLSADVSKIGPKSQKLRATVRIKVPAGKFNQVFRRVKKLGLKVVSENISGQDVTEEYIDLQSRLRNLETAESQLLELMKKAGSVSEILQVQKELVNTREKIERIKGRMGFLKKSAKMATITVDLATEEGELPIVEEKWQPKKVVKSALRSQVRFWQRIGSVILWSLIFFSPFILLGGPFLLWKKRKRS